MSYFENLEGAVLHRPATGNPCDWLLDVVTRDRSNEGLQLSQRWRESEQRRVEAVGGEKEENDETFSSSRPKESQRTTRARAGFCRQFCANFSIQMKVTLR